jgi:hypothetical protein
MSTDDATAYLSQKDSVPGWFLDIDARLFLAVNALQTGRGIRGNLLEIGAYHGKSAILLGFCLQAGERLVVSDTFEHTGGHSAEGIAEHLVTYSSLRQQEFERHYRRFHPSLPELIVGPSAELDRIRLARQFRLIHVDGGHEYQVVREDILTARALLGDGGIVIFDDWSQPHCPGVAMALWESYQETNLIPLGFTDTKMYATWAPAFTADDLHAWVQGQPDLDQSYAVRLGQHAVRRYTPKKVAPPTSLPEPSRWRRLLHRTTRRASKIVELGHE